jgi:ferric-dicitrate binding protein FerR (iron transport regulator)
MAVTPERGDPDRSMGVKPLCGSYAATQKPKDRRVIGRTRATCGRAPAAASCCNTGGTRRTNRLLPLCLTGRKRNHWCRWNAMNRSGRRTLLGGLMAALTLPALPDCASAAARAGVVESSRGECFARTRASKRALAPQEEVFIGDSVATGVQSSLGLHLGAATRVQLGPEAQLRIDRFVVNAGGILVLDSGAMLYDHDAGGDEGNVAVRSPFGLVAVRGTRFFAGPSNGVLGVFVERGDVLVVGANTAVYLAGGQGTDIAAPGAEPTAPIVWGAKRIAAAMASVAP